MKFTECGDLRDARQCAANVRDVVEASPAQEDAGDVEREERRHERVGGEGDEGKEDELEARERIEEGGGGGDAVDGAAGAERGRDDAAARLGEVREERGGDAGVEVEGEKLRVLQRGVQRVAERVQADHVEEQVQRLDVRKRRQQQRRRAGANVVQKVPRQQPMRRRKVECGENCGVGRNQRQNHAVAVAALLPRRHGAVVRHGADARGANEAARKQNVATRRDQHGSK